MVSGICTGRAGADRGILRIDCTERVRKRTAVGVIIDDQLNSMDHISNLLDSCTSLLYALRVL